MAIRKIVELGNPILRQTSREVANAADASQTLADLRDTLHEFQRTHGFGRGIAAVQIGLLERVVYIEIEKREYALLNPVIEWQSEEQFEMWDDCFSFPNLMVRLRRNRHVRVRYQDVAGAAQVIEVEGDFSELLQHEIDHLDGVLSIDHAIDPKGSFATRTEYLRTLRENLPR